MISLRDPLYFPSFRDTSCEDDPSDDYFRGWEIGYLTPKLHWCSVSEIVHRDDGFIRPRLQIQDQWGAKMDVNFHLDNWGLFRPLSTILVPGNTLCYRYGEIRYFTFGGRGFRVEDRHMPFMKVIPASLSKILELSDWVEAYLKGPSCLTCATKEKKLMACAKCKVANYCSKDCQAKNWGTHKLNCGLICEMKTLLPHNPSNYERYISFAESERK